MSTYHHAMAKYKFDHVLLHLGEEILTRVVHQWYHKF